MCWSFCSQKRWCCRRPRIRGFYNLTPCLFFLALNLPFLHSRIYFSLPLPLPVQPFHISPGTLCLQEPTTTTTLLASGLGEDRPWTLTSSGHLLYTPWQLSVDAVFKVYRAVEGCFADASVPITYLGCDHRRYSKDINWVHKWDNVRSSNISLREEWVLWAEVGYSKWAWLILTVPFPFVSKRPVYWESGRSVLKQILYVPSLGRLAWSEDLCLPLSIKWC